MRARCSFDAARFSIRKPRRATTRKPLERPEKFDLRLQREALTDDVLREMLTDGTSAFAPRRGEWDASVRLQELEADGVAGEVIFPQMVPFGASLLQYRGADVPEHNHVGNRAYNRWLADLCNANPGRHAGVAVISVDDIDVAVAEVRDAHEHGLFGGVLLPGSTGDHPYYHHPRYEPLWTVCEELHMPLQAHSSWSPDYGDVPCATAMYISEVDMWAHRPFTALVWSGAFERHPGLKLVFTEQGCSWILETLRCLEFKADNPIFQHFTKDLSLRPTEYFQRQCFMGASFLHDHESPDRYKIGIDKLMYGTDYPHLEGTWPNTMPEMQKNLAAFSADELAAVLGENALAVYDFDPKQVREVAHKNRSHRLRDPRRGLRRRNQRACPKPARAATPLGLDRHWTPRGTDPLPHCLEYSGTGSRCSENPRGPFALARRT